MGDTDFQDPNFDQKIHTQVLDHWIRLAKEMIQFHSFTTENNTRQAIKSFKF